MLLKRIIEYYKKKPMFYHWLRTYLILLCIALLFTTAIYLVFVKALDENVKMTNSAYLNKLKSQIEADMVSIQSTCANVAQGNSIDNLMNSNTYTDDKILDWTRGAISDFRSYKASSKYIEEMFIVFRNKDICIDSTGKYTRNIAFEIWFSNYFGSVNEWEKEVFSNHIKEYKVLRDNNGHKKVVCYQTLPIINSFDPKAVGIIMINEKAINNYLVEASGIKGSQAYILNQNGEVIFKSSDLIGEPQKLKDKNGVSQLNLNEKEYVVFYETSADFGWKYVMNIPKDVYKKSINMVKGISVFSFVFCIFLGIYLSFKFSKNNYTPLESIIEKVKAYSNKHDQSGSEYQYISDAVNDIIADKNQYVGIMEKQRTMLKPGFLELLLKGKINIDKDIDKDFKSYDIEFLRKAYLVILFDVEELGVMETKNETIEWENYKLAFFLISNVFEELIGEVSKCYFCECDELYACILNLDGNDEQLDFVNEKLKYMLKFLKENMKITFVCTVSEMRCGIDALPFLYRQTSEAMGYHVFESEENILQCTNVLYNDTDIYKYDIDTERMLINNILLGDYERTSQVLNEIFNANFENSNLDLKMARLFVFEVVSTVIKAARELNCARNVIETQSLELANKVFTYEKVDKIKKELDEVIRNVCILAKNGRKSNNEELKEKILSLVDMSYKNYNFSLKTVASDAGITPNYLSAFFKEQIGKGFADYVAAYRINKAREYLHNDKLTINDIAKMTGFSNSNVFIRTFKKIEGVTPGQYKDKVLNR